MTSAARSTDPYARPVARLSSPGEIVAVLPVLCGFTPHESLVVLSLRGPRRRVGLTMRFDLDLVDEPGLLGEVVERLHRDGAEQAVVVVLTGQSDPPRGLVRARAVHELVQRCGTRGIQVQEAVLARAGRWWSYSCARDCCPAAGTPVPGSESPTVRAVETAGVLEGRAVLASREQLAASVAAPRRQAAAAATRRQRLAGAERDVRVERAGVERERERALAVLRSLLDVSLSAGGVDGSHAAELAVAVRDVQVRDEVATWALDRQDALLALLQQAARQVAGPGDAPLCGLLAWVAYAAGDGGLANVALDRCLTSDPTSSLGLLLARALHEQLPPADLRTVLSLSRRSRSGAPDER